MPIAQRSVEPVLVYQRSAGSSTEAGDRNDCLPSTSLVALTSIIRQLSAISKYADEMFGEVFNEASKYLYRSNKLEERITALAQAMSESKDGVEGAIRDVPPPGPDKPEQHILNVYIPRALKEKYHSCNPAPDLGSFAKLRTDGRDGLAIYTDPTLFFRQWLYNMNREANVLRNPNKKRLRRSRSMRAGGAGYIQPPSASPPPQLSSGPVYENRAEPILLDTEEVEEEEENIYETLPEQVPMGTPPLVIPECPARPPSFTAPPPLQASTPPGLAARNRSYDLSMEFERHLERRAEEAHSPLTATTPHKHGESMLSVRSSLNSLNLDSYTRDNRVDPMAEGIYDNNRLVGQRSMTEEGIPEYDGSFALDDLPPPPVELLGAPLLDPPVSPFRLPNIPPSPVHDYYDSLPSKIPDTSPLPPSTEPARSPVSQESPQNDLLAAIRAGINLRPMKKPQDAPVVMAQTPVMHDVASILQRRKFLIGDVVGGSDSSEESSGEWDEDDDNWN